MMKHWVRLVCAVAVVGSSTGCATLLSGTRQTILIDSYPPGAKVTYGHFEGTTPVRIEVRKGEDYPLRISHGPDTRGVVLRRKFDPLTLLNLVPPFWPGFIVDIATGAITKFDPEVVRVDFRTTGSGEMHLTGWGP